MTGARPFLTAQWRYLAMLNYRVAPSLLAPLVPAGTELDEWNGSYFVSVVGFQFLGTRVLGVPIPFHRNFDEVNLRFYVRRTVGRDVRRGVVFVREVVPRAVIAFVARAMYNEPYVALRMRHRIDAASTSYGEEPTRVAYAWRQPSGWSSLAIEPTGTPSDLAKGSEEEFITEHHWGYTRQRDGGTIEYGVVHPRWRVWQVARSYLEGNLAELYGAEFGAVLAQPPASAFLAEGSRIGVYAPTRL